MLLKAWKTYEVPPTLFEKNAKYHVITGEGAFSASVPKLPNSVELLEFKL